MRKGNGSAIFLDTSYILPYFGVQLDKIDSEELDRVLNQYDEIHISETSILEAKGKMLRLAIRDEDLHDAVLSFGENLDILTGDSRIIFHRYRGTDDHFFNLLSLFKPKLNFFDQIILAQSVSVGSLLTEDEVIMVLSRSPEFRVCKEFQGLNIVRFRDL